MQHQPARHASLSTCALACVTSRAALVCSHTETPCVVLSRSSEQACHDVDLVKSSNKKQCGSSMAASIRHLPLLPGPGAVHLPQVLVHEAARRQPALLRQHHAHALQQQTRTQRTMSAADIHQLCGMRLNDAFTWQALQ